MTRGRLAAAVGLAAVLYTAAFWLLLTEDLADRRTLVILVVATGVVFTVTGAVAAANRPDNPTGAQMLAVGLVWSLGSLQAADNAVLFTLGYVLSSLAFVPFTLLILSYPTGRLPARDRWIVLAVLAVVTLGPLTVVLFDPTPIATCNDCPESAFLVTDSTALARAPA